ncbi:MAG: TetR family transcriptional regulator [Candidatus Dormibacteraceae bacterium]
MSDRVSRRPGLRERKKTATHTTIQRHALRLFCQQGYEATTMSQIAEAAEVSESTIFRYFPTKEQLVVSDDFDPRMAEALRTQPPEYGPIQALRAAFRNVLEPLSASERDELRGRVTLMLEVPPLRAVAADQLGRPMRLLAEVLARRAGRQSGDFAVRTLVGAVLGACMSAMLAVPQDPAADVVALIDAAMAQLETGLSL